MIYEPESKLVLGGGMDGLGAADLIAEAGLAVEMGAELDDIAELVHPHPGAGESLGAAARAASRAADDKSGRTDPLRRSAPWATPGAESI
jgi:dihydrolipoamide dehydrogenase